MDKNLLDFFERLQKLRWIDRCSNTLHIKPYSVAQHSFYVAFYGVIFSKAENKRLETFLYNPGVVAIKALCHDLEESETGDILFPLHNENLVFKEKLDSIREACVEQKVFQEFEGELKVQLISIWKGAKDATAEGIMVSCMDKFEILMYAMTELGMGNNSMREIYDNAIHIIRSDFNIPSVLDVVTSIENRFGKVL